MDGTDDIFWRSLWADDESHLEESKNNRRHLRSAPHLPGISPLRSRPCSNTARDVASARGKPRLRNSSLSMWGNWNRTQPAPLRSRKSRPDATRPVPSHCLRSGRYASARRWIGRPDPVDGQTRPAGSGSLFPAAAMSGGGEGGKALSEQSPSDRLPRGDRHSACHVPLWRFPCWGDDGGVFDHPCTPRLSPPGAPALGRVRS